MHLIYVYLHKLAIYTYVISFATYVHFMSFAIDKFNFSIGNKQPTFSATNAMCPPHIPHPQVYNISVHNFIC